MKKYFVIYGVEIEAKNIEKAEELAYLEETKHKVKLKIIEGNNESWKIFYDVEDSTQGNSTLKPKRK